MANPADDPYYPHSKITHPGVTSADAAVPIARTIFQPKSGHNAIKCWGYLNQGTATILLAEYAGKLSEQLDDESWPDGGEEVEWVIDASSTAQLVGHKFLTDAGLVSIRVKEITGGGTLTLVAALAAKGVADR